MSKIILKYSPPKLRVFKNGYWEVKCFLFHPITGKEHPHRESQGLNRKGATKKEREKTASFIIADMLARLKAGEINPWPELAEMEPEEKVSDITVSAALLEALEIKKIRLEKTSANDYSSCLNIYILALNKLGYGQKRLVDFKKREAVHALEQIQVERKFSDFRWNIYKDRISSVMSVLVDPLEYIPINPLHRVPHKKYVKGTVFKPATPDQQEKIDVHLYNNNRPLFIAMHIIQFAGVRCKETLSIQRDDVDFDRLTITITGQASKNKKAKTVPITEELASLLKEHLATYIGNLYLFGIGLKPAAKQIHRNTLSGYWKKEIINKKTGLGLPVKMYSEKHFGADKKILQGVPLEYLRKMYGHHSQQMTGTYISNLQQVANDFIREKAPSILPVAKEK